MAVAVAEKGTDKRGVKRICTSCGTRFYDFNKRPVTCPSCKAEFTGENKVKNRRGRVAAIEEDEAPSAKSRGREEGDAPDDEDIEDGDDMVISLDDVEEMEEGDEDEDLESMDMDEDEDLGDINDLDEDDLEEDADEPLDEDER